MSDGMDGWDRRDGWKVDIGHRSSKSTFGAYKSERTFFLQHERFLGSGVQKKACFFTSNFSYLVLLLTCSWKQLGTTKATYMESVELWHKFMTVVAPFSWSWFKSLRPLEDCYSRKGGRNANNKFSNSWFIGDTSLSLMWYPYPSKWIQNTQWTIFDWLRYRGRICLMIRVAGFWPLWPQHKLGRERKNSI